MTVRVSSIVALLFLLGSVSALNWQGGGNITDYLDAIWKNLHSHFDSNWNLNVGLNTFVAETSDDLNSLYDPFWNVVASYYNGMNFDGVLYGYAFRGHWFWINGLGYNHYSIIIWKDYNCIHQYAIEGGYNSGSSLWS